MGLTALKTIEERLVPVEEIELNYRNPRQDFTKEDLAELASSLTRHGQLQPITVRRKGERYELVVGERRVRAGIYADIPKLRAEIVDLTDSEADAMRLVENIHRKDLEIWEKVDGLEAYWERYLKAEQEQELSTVRQTARAHETARLNAKYGKLSELIGVPSDTIKSWYSIALETKKSSARSAFVRRLGLTSLREIAPFPSGIQEKLAEVIVEKDLNRDDVRSFVRLYVKNPDVELSTLADRAMTKTETVIVRLPKERAEQIRKEAESFRKKLAMKDRRAIRHELELRRKKEEERKALQHLQKNLERPPPLESQMLVAAELTKRFLAKKQGITTPDEQHNLVTSAYAGGKLTRGEADLALELWKQNPRWDFETIVRQARTKFSDEEAKRKPQPAYLLIEPQLYARLRAYADSKRVDFKEAIYSLLDYALDHLGFKGVGV